MPEISVTEFRLLLRGDHARHEAPPLKQVFGSAFDSVVNDWSTIEDSPRFAFPRLQFKVCDRQAILFGLNEGSELLQQQLKHITETVRDSRALQVSDVRTESFVHDLNSAEEPLEYRFATPWLALNRKNLDEYRRTRSPKTRAEGLNRILVGNFMGLAQSLEIRFDEWISADASGLTAIKTEVGGRSTMGFIGKIRINLRLPDYLGVGRAAAAGFGTLVPS